MQLLVKTYCIDDTAMRYEVLRQQIGHCTNWVSTEEMCYLQECEVQNLLPMQPRRASLQGVLCCAPDCHGRQVIEWDTEFGIQKIQSARLILTDDISMTQLWTRKFQI